MDDILAEIYSTIIPSAPYIIAAYALVWVALLIYVLVIATSTRRSERQLEILEEAYESTRRSNSPSGPNGETNDGVD